MGRKKTFIDKKTAATFRLVCRDSSASDPRGLSASSDKVFTRVDNGSSYVPGFTDDDPIIREQSNLEDPDSIFADAQEEDDDLGEEFPTRSGSKSHSIPKSSNNPYVVEHGPLPDHVRREILELGLPDDGYNYLSHMREIRVSGGGSAFVPNPKADISSLPADVKAYDASKLQVEANNEDDTSSSALYALSTRIHKIRNVQKAADPEVLAHLEKSDGSECDSDEVLDEDFVIQANQPEEAVEGECSMRTPEIKQEHLQGIKPSTGQENHAASSFKKFFDGALQFLTDDNTENGALQDSEKQRIPRLLDEEFELLALREYNDGENDASDVFDYDTMGAVDIHAPEIDQAMKEFLTNNLDFQDKYTVPGDLHRHTNPESSIKSQKSAKLHDSPESESQKTAVDDVIRKCAVYAEMYENESQEDNEILLVEKSSSDDEAWDCETIISTYSNLDNHPAKIGAPQKPRKKNISEVSSRSKEMHEAVIPLRGRQQLPVDFLPKIGNSRKNEANSKSEINSKNMAHARVGETVEQKKARKSAVKEEKREARRAKKELKVLYRGESQRVQHVVAVAGPPSIHLM